jgi:cation:H+ antiporter
VCRSAPPASSPVKTTVADRTLWPNSISRSRRRTKGPLLLVYYGAYTAYLLLAAPRHEALPLFNRAVLYFALPLTVLTLLVTVLQA